MPENKSSNAQQNDSFAASFRHFKLSRGCKEDWRKQGRDWITGYLTRLCALLKVNTHLEGYYFWYFKGVLT